MRVELEDEGTFQCDCCGNPSRKIWGWVHDGDRTVAAYWVHWTVGHLDTSGASFDLVVGKWGDGADASDRFAVSLIYCEPVDGPAAFRVVDAKARSIAKSPLIGAVLDRDEVIGTPTAAEVFALIDVIWLQDGRLFKA